ncbi:MAG TPA: 3-deoxy-D-manno-octulosonic acid transferase [Pyrinomonadaceae bacterium]
MLVIYSIAYSLGFIAMLPLFLLRHEKYASGFRERLGHHPEFKQDDRKVIWLHCVSVGETNAARPLVDELIRQFPAHRLVMSTTTRTGQKLAKGIFRDKADAVFYFPFDWKFSVRRALKTFRPSLILLMETEIWPRFISEAKRSGSKVAIVNGRLSQRSFARYSRIRFLISRILRLVDRALMQTSGDAERVVSLGMDAIKVHVTGNLKFESTFDETNGLVKELRSRFGVSSEKPMIIAASTHEPEERLVLESLDGELGYSCRLMIAPRHPERFDAVERLLEESSLPFVRRTSPASEADKTVPVILLDTIGELRDVYPLAEIVFVGGSLIPHGGQSVLEPAAAGRAIVTGPYTANFDAVLREFVESEAVRQTPIAPDDHQISERLFEEFILLLENHQLRLELGQNAAAVMKKYDRGATARTIEFLSEITDN